MIHHLVIEFNKIEKLFGQPTIQSNSIQKRMNLSKSGSFVIILIHLNWVLNLAKSNSNRFSVFDSQNVVQYYFSQVKYNYSFKNNNRCIQFFKNLKINFDITKKMFKCVFDDL